MSDERWLPVIDFEGFYEVSTLGRVKLLDRIIIRSTGAKYTAKGKIKIISNGRPYPVVTLKKCGSCKVVRVHKLVMEAFVGSCPEGMEVCHGNGIVSDVRLINLRYDTRKANHADKKLHGTSNTGSRHGNSKLTEDDVVSMRLEYGQGGVTYKQLGDRYGINLYQVGLIIRREGWVHI